MNENETTNVAENTAPEAAPATPQEAPTKEAEAPKSYDTLLGNNAEQQANTNTEAPQGQQEAEQVTYNFADTVKAYEGFEFSQKNSDEFVGVIKDMGLSNEQANAVVKYGMDWANGLVNDVRTQMQNELDDMVKGWGETAKQELGSNFDATISKAGSAIEMVEKAVPGIRQALQETGAGNRIEFIRALAFFADKVAGDPGMINGVKGSQPVDDFAQLYPNTDWSSVLK